MAISTHLTTLNMYYDNRHNEVFEFMIIDQDYVHHEDVSDHMYCDGCVCRVVL